MNTTAKDFVIVSPKFLPELRKLPDDVLSITAALDDVCSPCLVLLRLTLAGPGDQIHQARDRRPVDPRHHQSRSESGSWYGVLPPSLAPG